MTARFNLEPFASPGYRRYFFASTLAALGLWVYQPAIEWIVLAQTGLAGSVGLLQTALILGVALATLPSGVLAERVGARRTIAISLLGMGATIGVVALLATLSFLRFEVALVLTFGLGIFDGLFSVPAVLLLAQVVEPRYLGSAIGLSFLTGGLGRLIGGPLGGSVLQIAGPAPAFVPAAIALGVSAAVLLSAPAAARVDHQERIGRPGDLRACLRYLRTEPVVLAVAVFGTLSAASIFAYSALLPAYTRDNLEAGPATLGLLSGAGGVGTVAGAFLMETAGRRAGRGRLVVGAFIASGLAIGALGLTHLLPVALALAAAITLLSMAFGGTAQLIVQTMPPPGLRAGVVAIYTLAYYCLLPVATAVGGRLADAVGVEAVLLGMAALTLLGAGLVLAVNRELLGVDLDEDGAIVRRERPRLAAGVNVDGDADG